jgi:hypothetical protein
MMATVTGTVASIGVIPDTGVTGPTTGAKVVLVEQGTTTQETFTLWFEAATVFTPPPQWIARTSALSLLRDALINKLTVTITTATATSSAITEVSIA